MIANTLQTTCNDYSRADGFNIVSHTLRAEGFDASEDGTGRGTPLVPVAFNWQAGGSRDMLGYDPESGVSSALHVGQVPAIAFAQNQRDEVRDLGDTAGALAAEPGMKQQTYVAFQCHGSNVGEMGTLRAGNGNESGGVPFVINEKGRPEGRTLEYRDDGTINALLTPSGGRAGIGVGAIAGPQSGVRRLTPRECERLQGFPDDWTRYAADGREIADGPRYRMLGNAVCVNVAQWIGQRIIAVEGE